MASGRGLTLLAGPANAGKVALLLERYLGALDRDPISDRADGSDVERIERELLAKCGALLSGRIGTFDDLFEEIARAGGSNLPVATDAQRQLIVRTAVAQTSLNGFGASARFSGFSTRSERHWPARIRARRARPAERRPRTSLLVVLRTSSRSLRALGPAYAGDTPPTSSPVSSTPGRTGPSSPTASRT